MENLTDRLLSAEEEVQRDLMWIKTFELRDPEDIVNGMIASSTMAYIEDGFITEQNYWMRRMKHWCNVKKAYWIWMEEERKKATQKDSL